MHACWGKNGVMYFLSVDSRGQSLLIRFCFRGWGLRRKSSRVSKKLFPRPRERDCYVRESEQDGRAGIRLHFCEFSLNSVHYFGIFTRGALLWRIKCLLLSFVYFVINKSPCPEACPRPGPCSQHQEGGWGGAQLSWARYFEKPPSFAAYPTE